MSKWIVLTSLDGSAVTFGIRHIVLMKEHGDGTLVIHRNGAEVVKESQVAIFRALRLLRTGDDRRNTEVRPRVLDS